MVSRLAEKRRGLESASSSGWLIACAAIAACFAGCASRPGWGFSWGQGTIDRQKSRAAVHDPYPLNDIGPEVVGGRPREFFNPEPEPARNQVTQTPVPMFRP